MTKAPIIAYFVIAFLVALWSEAMDERWLPPNERGGYVTHTFFGLCWPILVPASLLEVAVVDAGGRWSCGMGVQGACK